MRIEDTQNVLFMKMFMDSFSNQIGKDSPAFSVMLESMSKALEGNESFISQGNSSQIKNMYSSEGSSILSKDMQNTVSQIRNEISSEMRNEIKGGNSSDKINKAIKNAAAKYGVEESFIRAVIMQESSFDPLSKSSAGAMGLMQLMPGTAASLGVTNAYDIDQNVDGGTKYLKGLLESFGNCKEMALAAYNAGPNGVRRRGVTSPGEIYKLPRETRGYVDKVMKYYKGAL
ncbi:lytic transglycosylase domain-containing protein [Clostridium sp. KNHs214]|uniref:lytic transglycosylase domain-containing protein n=1 Tax=Clostridium sp. KNHs214 TaxID=1540257 RepID=UPI000556F53E|nr:lytic transglycosylase domain-containing protein [Clostridium sp. KNHs214]